MKFTYFTRTKALDYIVPLSLSSLRMYDVNIQSIVYQLMKEFLCSLNTLDKNEHRWSESLRMDGARTLNRH